MLQRVRQGEMQIVASAKIIAGLRQLQSQLQVRDGVGRRQQLIAGKARQEVLRDVILPLPGSALETMMDMSDETAQERARPDGRIEYVRGRVSQPIRHSEISSQQMI